MRKTILILAILLGLFSAKADEAFKVKYNRNTSNEVQLDFVLGEYKVIQTRLNSVIYNKIEFQHPITTEKKGYAELPYLHASIELMNNNNVSIEVEPGEYIDYQLDYDLVPSRGTIYRSQNPTKIPYTIDPASITDSWYPNNLVKNTEPYILKDKRGVNIFVYPFVYNAKQRTLRVYKTLKVRVVENKTKQINPLKQSVKSELIEMKSIYQSIFINYKAPKNIDIDQYGDILLITTARDTVAIKPYIKWKREKGFNVEQQVVATSTNVKSLIKQRYNANNNILYAVLVGDWDDLKSDLGPQSGPMDPQLGCVAGTDKVADIIIGRISANSSTDVTNQINKFISYEQNPDLNAAWYSEAMGISSSEGGSGKGDDGEADSTHQRIIFENKLSKFTYTKYHRVSDPTAVAADITAGVESGVSIINYSGHGSQTAWSTTNFSNTKVDALKNENRTPVIISVACNNGDFHKGKCFAEAWLRKSNGGAIAMLAASISQPWDPPMRGQDYFNDILTGGYNYDNNNGQSGINTTEGRSIFGSIAFNSLALMTTESNGESDWNTVKTWNIFGDPTIQVRTKSPGTLAISNNKILTGVDFTTTVTVAGIPAAGAQLCISKDGKYFSAMSNATGQVTIPHTFTNGTAKLVVTAQNATTIYEDANIIQTNGPYIIVSSTSINDATANNNQLLDFNETALLNVDIKNVGLENTTGISASLTSSDPLITIINNSHSFGDINSDEIIQGNDAFSIKLADNIPDQHVVKFDIDFTNSASETWNAPIYIVGNAPNINLESMSISNESGIVNGILEAGETADLEIEIKNIGHATSLVGNALISTLSSDLIINNNSKNITALAPNATLKVNFSVTADAGVDLGTPATIKCEIETGKYNFNKDFSFKIGEVPIYMMSNNTIESCVGKFTDTGGETGDYQKNETYVLTIKPSTLDSKVRLNFTSFNIESGYDFMYIYDGSSVSATQIGNKYTGTNSPGEIIATNAAGALTIKFKSDAIVNKGGWVAEISCAVITNITTTKEEFSIYPNPASSTVNINCLNEGQYEILNLAGVIVSRNYLERGHNSIDIKSLKTGVYIVKVKNTNKSAAYKLIVK